MQQKIEQLFQESIQVKNQVVLSGILKHIVSMGLLSTKAIQRGNKLLLCGNGGSAADAQHLAAEMLIRLRPDNNREGIPAIALAQDTSTITACGNDFGYDQLFERLVQTLGYEGDVLIAITTSGNSKNIINSFEYARNNNIKEFAITGFDGGMLKSMSKYGIHVATEKNEYGIAEDTHLIIDHLVTSYIRMLLKDE